MLTSRLSEVAHYCHGLLAGDDQVFAGVSTDSRDIPSGSLFVALRGPRHDAHDYLSVAAERGAAGAVVTRKMDAPLPTISVADTFGALTGLGAMARARHRGTVVGITGSNGKTTVKELTAAILGESGPTLATRGNLNNEIGVPLTLCRLGPLHAHAVIEMGAGGPGDIAPLAALVRPGVSILTCCAPAHLERFGSLDAVAETKGAIYAALPEDGTAVLPVFDRYADYWRGVIGDRRTIGFGLSAEAEVRAESIVLDESGCDFMLVTPMGSTAVRLHILGQHNVLNALAAAAAAIAVGCTPAQITAGLASVRPVNGRLQPLSTPAGRHLIHDAYNANPGSLAAAVNALAAISGRCHVVLGDMAELGVDAAAMHREAGVLLRAAGIEHLYGIGPLSRLACEAFGQGASWFEDLEALATAVLKQSPIDVRLLIKGSRAQGLERLVDRLMQEG